MDLGDNRLASIHGLEECKSLLELNLAENRIARIGEIGFGLPRFIPKPVPRRHLSFYLLSCHCYSRWLVRMSPAAETDSGWKLAHQLKGVVDALYIHSVMLAPSLFLPLPSSSLLSLLSPPSLHPFLPPSLPLSLPHQLKSVVDALGLPIHPFSNACSLFSFPRSLLSLPSLPRV